MLISNSAASHMRLQELEPDEEDFALPAGAKGPGASGTAAPAADTAAPELQAWQPPVSSSALSQLPPTPMQVQERQRLVVERQAEQQERAQLPERGAGSNGRGPGADAGSGSPAAPQFALATASNRATGPRMRSFIDDPDEPGLRRGPPTRPGLGQPPAASPPSASIEPPQPPLPYAGERSADPEWLAERETALKAVRADYEAQGATARADGSGAGWIEVETVGESTTTCSLEFSEETFAAHYRAQAGAPLQTLARSYATDAATLLAREPGIWALCTQDHALNAGPAQAGRAMGDPGQLATLDLYMADPQVAELIDRFGGNVAAPSGPVALEQVRVHGAARYAQLTRLDHAMQAVRADYSHAMQQAQQQGGPGWLETPLTWTATDEAGTISSGTLLKRDDDGNVVLGPDGAPVAQTRRDFDPDTFTAWYVQQDGVANKAFAAFYGRSHTTWGESVINEGGATTKSAEISFDNPSWHISGIGAPMVHRALATIEPNRPPRLNDPTAVGFDLEAGWATSAGNIHQSRDWFETVVQVGLVAFTGYVGALVIGPAAAGGLGFATGSVGAAVVSGAVAGAASSLASGVINGDVSLKGVLQGALAGGLTAGLMGSLGNTVTTAAGPAGTIALRATVQGGINALLGGKFETGAIAGLASGLAAQLGADMSKGIDKALAEGTMDAGQAIAARSMARIVASAVRVLGNLGDPQYAFASDLLGGLVNDGVAAADRARLPATPSDGEPSFVGAAFDDEGNLMPGIVDPSATPVQQQAQLLAHLQAQGMSEEDAASLTYETLVQDTPQTLQPPSAESSTWTPQELQARIDEVDRQVQEELLAQQLRADSLLTADELSEQTGGAGNGNGRAPIRPVINGNFEAALNAASDVAGLTQPMAEMHGALAELQAVQAEGRIESMRAAMRAAGMANVPEGFERAWVAGGAMVRDYGATVDKLQAAYQDFLTDRRYTETWGANWRNARVGRSQMTVREFESTTLRLQQQAANEAYERGKVALATGELPLDAGGYAQTLGNYMDRQVRTQLRAFGASQGLPDSSVSNLFAVNRLIRGAGLAGIPDLRTGTNTISDVTLSPKDGTYDQLRRWNAMVPNDTVIIRPEGMPGGGSYVVPRRTIRPLIPPGKGG